jgi:hypothetical protein
VTDLQTRDSAAGEGAGIAQTKTLTIKQAINETLFEEMRRDPTIVILGCDVGIRGNPFGVTKGLYEEFGQGRVLDTPISEAHIGSSLPDLARPTTTGTRISLNQAAIATCSGRSAPLRSGRSVPVAPPPST